MDDSIQTNRKQRFINYFNHVFQRQGKVSKIVIAVKLPSGGTEIVINSDYITTKLDYITSAYNEDLKLNNNPCIEIIDYMIL